MTDVGDWAWTGASWLVLAWNAVLIALVIGSLYYWLGKTLWRFRTFVGAVIAIVAILIGAGLVVALLWRSTEWWLSIIPKL